MNDSISTKIITYLENSGGFTPAAADCVYLPTGEQTAAYLLDALKKAKRYIWLEFFTIEKGILWGDIQEILANKAAQGLDVRVVYDGFGCLFVFPKRIIREMTNAGIKVRAFKPDKISHRNHRKIAVIDGEVTFCGGLNLSDRYANLEEMFGYWKDSAVMITETAEKQSEPTKPSGQATVCVPLFDIPKARIAEHTLINFIARAERYVYITTPYLMCGSGILSVMSAAAYSGVDVRVITPFIADKKAVKAATESYYKALLNGGVRVFEYTPGFIHAKSLISDGKRAFVGSVNLDYRSLYLNYECGVCLFEGQAVDDISRDFTETLAQCKEITLADLEQVSLFKRAVQRFCRIFARVW
jgi:cardiolipin synthase